jgi:hypothetical protein
MIYAPASVRTWNGAADASNQKPLFLPVSPSCSCDVGTINVFIASATVRGEHLTRAANTKVAANRRTLMVVNTL